MPGKKTELQAPEAAAIAEENLKNLFKITFGGEITDFSPLKGDASARRLFRIKNDKRSAIGAIGPDKLENAAFIEFSKHFRKEKMPVPEIYAEDLSKGVYLEEDLGDLTLFGFLQSKRTGPEFPETALAAYKKALDWLPR